MEQIQEIKPVLLSLLIPLTPDREIYMPRLRETIARQISECGLDGQVEVLEFLDNHWFTTGFKRNQLVERAQGKYYAFIDSDDMISPDYLKLVLPGILGDYDCCSLWGNIYFNGKRGKPFHHSIEHHDLWENETQYFRPVNHLNVVKRELVKDIKFKNESFGEDSVWALVVENQGVLKNEYKIDSVLYFYYSGFPKHEVL